MGQQQNESGGDRLAPPPVGRAERTGERRHAGRFYLVAIALAVGVLAGFGWLSQAYLYDLFGPYEEARVPPATAPALPTESAVSAPTAEEMSAQDTTARATPTRVVLAVSAAATPQPTRTPTPVPYLDNTEAVVGLGGGQVWNADGSQAGLLAQGAYVTASKRSADGAWVFTGSDDALNGWMSVDDLIIFDTERLAPVDVNIVPVTPTVVPQAGDMQAAQPAGERSESVALPTVTPPSGKGFAPPSSGRLATARIALDDSRLNVRAGPGDTYRVIAKALPEEMYTLIARSEDADWVQIELPDTGGAFGWVSASYLESSEDLRALPTSSALSSLPSYGAADESPAAEPAAAPVEKAPSNIGGLPPLQLGPAAPGITEGSPDAENATGLSGKLAIQEKWGGSIYIYDLSSGDLRLLTGGFDPAISPDGNLVAFTREGGENGVYVIDIETGEERLLFGGREHLRSPKFSPDGQYIVFERGDESILCKDDQARCRLSVPSPDGDLPERERQPSLARIRVDGSDYWDPMDLPYARVPDWNEGGIVYQSPGGLQIAQNEPDVDTVLVYFDILKQYEMDPDWQPEAGRIAFQQREISHWEIFVVEPDGSGLQALTQPPFALAESFPSNVSPAWSPDGRHIVFLSNRSVDNTAGEWGVWVMDADGANQRPLPIELPFEYTYVSEQMLDWGP